MAGDEDLDAWISLSLTPGLGGESLRRLLREFGTPQQIYAAPARELARIIKQTLAQQIARGVDEQAVAPTLAWLREPGNFLITLADDDYPRPLLQISDPPPVFFLKGRRELLSANALAIVGSRNATPQGIANAEAFAQALSEAGHTIISGLALGIDAAAHRGGMRGAASSMAIVGTGLDIVYPARNRELAHELAAKGALVSELPLGTPAVAGNFPRRNRLISGMSRGCLVVEATLSSGSLITARLAAEQGREVFAIPGSIHSPFSKGCHRLIKQGAKLVESAQDVLEELGGAAAAVASATPVAHAPELLEHLGYDPVGIDELITRSGLSAETINAMLLQLELEGWISVLPGARYQRLR